MKITTERKALLRALTAAVGIVERRVTIPILANVHMTAADGSLIIKATDLDIETTDRIAATVAKPGATTASAQMLMDIVKRLPDGAMIEIETEGYNLTVKAGRSRFQIPTMPADDFPAMASPQYDTTFSIGAKAFARIMDKAKFSMSTEETRYYLNGIYLHIAGDMLRGVSTDGHRLARVDVAAPDGALGMAGVIVPRKTVAEIAKLAAASAGDLVVSVSETKIRLASDTVAITSKVIDGTFPDYTRVIPTDSDKTARIDAGDLRASIDRVVAVSSERTSAVKLAFSQDALKVSHASATGSAQDTTGAAYDGPAFEIGINGKYALELLGQVTGDAVLQMSDAGAPVVVLDTDDTGLLMVVMPMRVV
jgi:DNA polymerase-3 subunit beta